MSLCIFVVVEESNYGGDPTPLTATSASSPDHTQSALAQYENSANGPNPWYQFINSML